ncbi:MAG: cupin domain-containing protein [Candidatus Methylomirabilaceae bacterium]
MKSVVPSVLVLLCASSTAVQTSPSAIDVTAEEIQAALKQTADRRVSDQAIRMADVGGYNVGIGVVHRSEGPQGAIAHSKITEVYHVMEGAGTLVTGGTLVDPRPSPPESQVVTVLNGPSTGGSSIQAGQSRRIKAGDVVILPPNTPHWFSAMEGTIVYLVVRMDPEQVVRLK